MNTSNLQETRLSLKFEKEQHPLKVKKWEIFQRHFEGKKLGTFSLEYAKAADSYMKELVSKLEEWESLCSSFNPPALVAVGGYGRGELCLESDLDMLIAFAYEIPENAKSLSKALFYPLWDGGFDVGHSVRTIEDCINLAKLDTTVLSSLLDMRFICGAEDVFLTLKERFYKEVILEKETFVIDRIESALKSSRPTSLENIGFIEPNLKEGFGGLRSYHNIRWLTLINSFSYNITDSQDRYQMPVLAPLLPHVEFVEATRNVLHKKIGRKYDILKLENQPKVAQICFEAGLVDSTETESFLSVLLGHLLEMKFLSDAIASDICKSSRVKKITHDTSLYETLRTYRDQGRETLANGLNLLEASIEALRHGLNLGIHRINEVRDGLVKAASDQEVKRMLLYRLSEIIDKDFSHKVFEFLQRIGVLERLIEPFGKTKNKVQYDTYHLYPVDIHLFETLRVLCQIEKEGGIFEKTLFHEIKDKKVLLWSALLHDIGKGERRHNIVGAKKAKQILKDLGFDKKRMDQCLFLIIHHLLMAETATKRNLNEEKVIIECARKIKNSENAKMLYLLTWADSKATNPRVWNFWVEYLVQDLFLKVLHVFERGQLASPDAATKSIKNLKRAKELLKGVIPGDKLEELFQNMGIRYTLENSATDIKQHVEMAVKLLSLVEQGKEPLVLHWKEYEREKVLDLTVVTRDHPGLFSQISGVISLHDINILNANAYTWGNGIVIDILQLTYPPDPLKLRKTLIQIEEDMKKAINNELDLAALLAGKKPLFIPQQIHKKITVPPKVVINNNESDFFTVIEVQSQDKIGLLYTITNTLLDFGLDIRFAKISTKADLVLDYFYVKDKYGEKLTDHDRINDLQAALLSKLTQ